MVPQAALREAAAAAEVQPRPSNSSSSNHVNFVPFSSSEMSSLHNGTRSGAVCPVQEQEQQQQQQQEYSHLTVGIQPLAQQEQDGEQRAEETMQGAATEQQQEQQQQEQQQRQQTDSQVLPPNQEQVQQAVELHSPSFSEDSFTRSQPAGEANLPPKQVEPGWRGKALWDTLCLARWLARTHMFCLERWISRVPCNPAYGDSNKRNPDVDGDALCNVLALFGDLDLHCLDFSRSLRLARWLAHTHMFCLDRWISRGPCVWGLEQEKSGCGGMPSAIYLHCLER
eukprot:1161694-Pelagomonas_calceolata.AAC.4